MFMNFPEVSQDFCEFESKSSLPAVTLLGRHGPFTAISARPSPNISLKVGAALDLELLEKGWSGTGIPGREPGLLPFPVRSILVALGKCVPCVRC